MGRSKHVVVRISTHCVTGFWSGCAKVAPFVVPLLGLE